MTTSSPTILTPKSNRTFVPPPNVQITALPISITKVEVFGIAAFMEIGLARPNVKYSIENGRLRSDNVYKLAGIDVYSPLRTIKGASSVALNFLDEEIPKFI